MHLSSFMHRKKETLDLHKFYLQILSAFPIMMLGEINAMAVPLQARLVLAGLHFKHLSFPRAVWVSGLPFQNYSKAH